MIPYDLSRSRALVFDVDGVLSRNTVTLADDGLPIRTVNIKDGYALNLAARLGVLRLCVITGGKSEAVGRRYEGLGFHHVFQGVSKKIDCYEQWKADNQLSDDEVLYMGDDIPDLEVLRRVGCPVCPADAAPEVREVCLYISPRMGGEGCVRDVVEQVLRAQGHWLTNAEAFGW